MKQTFDSKVFENLSDRALGLYAAGMDLQNLPENYLEYFQANSARWDGQHLEAGLSLLGRLDSDAARHQIADFLGHPLDYIRLLVIRTLSRMPMDLYIASKIDERLKSASDKAEIIGLGRLQAMGARES